MKSKGPKKSASVKVPSVKEVPPFEVVQSDEDVQSDENDLSDEVVQSDENDLSDEVALSDEDVLSDENIRFIRKIPSIEVVPSVEVPLQATASIDSFVKNQLALKIVASSNQTSGNSQTGNAIGEIVAEKAVVSFQLNTDYQPHNTISHALRGNSANPSILSAKLEEYDPIVRTAYLREVSGPIYLNESDESKEYDDLPLLTELADAWLLKFRQLLDELISKPEMEETFEYLRWDQLRLFNERERKAMLTSIINSGKYTYVPPAMSASPLHKSMSRFVQTSAGGEATGSKVLYLAGADETGQIAPTSGGVDLTGSKSLYPAGADETGSETPKSHRVDTTDSDTYMKLSKIFSIAGDTEARGPAASVALAEVLGSAETRGSVASAEAPGSAEARGPAASVASAEVLSSVESANGKAGDSKYSYLKTILQKELSKQINFRLHRFPTGEDPHLVVAETSGEDFYHTERFFSAGGADIAEIALHPGDTDPEKMCHQSVCLPEEAMYQTPGNPSEETMIQPPENSLDKTRHHPPGDLPEEMRCQTPEDLPKESTYNPPDRTDILEEFGSGDEGFELNSSSSSDLKPGTEGTEASENSENSEKMQPPRRKNSVLKIKSYKFGCRIVKLHQFLQAKRVYALADQTVRSGTSVGANVYEATKAESMADFIHKLAIAHKELEETVYWLRLLKVGNYLPRGGYRSLRNDADELLRILGRALYTARSRGRGGR